MISKKKEMALVAISILFAMLVGFPILEAQAHNPHIFDPGRNNGSADECFIAPGAPDWCEILPSGNTIYFNFRTAHPGNTVTPFSAWGTNSIGGAPELPLTYKAGYCSNPINNYNDPMADLHSKVKYLRAIESIWDITADPENPDTWVNIDEKITKYKRPELLQFLTTWDAAFGIYADPFGPTPLLFYLPTFHVGRVMNGQQQQGRIILHIIDIYWGLSSEHCDGLPSLFGEPLERHCIPAPDVPGFENNEAFLGFSAYFVEP